MLFVVTGGAGFIGSHLTEGLLRRGNQVRIIDNLSTGSKTNLPPEAEFVQTDIRDLTALKDSLEGAEGVFHVAAMPRVQYSIEQPLETNAFNITGTLNVLLAARAAKVRRLVYSASSSAYGDQPSLPLREAMKPNPLSPYGLQKYVGEEYTKLASLLWGLKTVSLRYFNVYGPRMANQGAYVTVIAVFNRQKLAGEPLTITGNGTQTRDFTYVDDVVRANLLAMASPKVGRGEVINIGSGERHSVNEIAALIGGPVSHLPPRIEPHDTLADITQARGLLGWEPAVGFPEGLRRTMDWYERQPPTAG